MPTIEIVCVAQAEPIDFSGLPFAVRAENSLISHRALFQPDFDKMRGCIYHLGNPDLREDSDSVFWAYELIDEAIGEGTDEDYLRINDEFIPHLRTMLGQLLAASPAGRITFSSDWQFGAEGAEKFKAISEKKFWEMHDACELRFNTLYEIVA